MNTTYRKPIPKKYPLQTLIGVAIASLVIGFLAGLWVGGLSPTPTPVTANDAPIGDTVTRYDVSQDDDPALGPADAPVVIIEFSDYQCPYCKRWHDEVFERMLAEYGDVVRFVYRDFPLGSIHPFAAGAAEAANCANEQNAYWDYHQALFSYKYNLDHDSLLQYANDLGLDMTAFRECLESRRYRDEVQADYNAALQLGVNSTPTFFINGRPVIGAQPYEVFANIIEEELAAAGK